MPEAVSVKTNPTRNWVKILLCFPNIRLEITEDNRNIQANAHTKTTTVVFELRKDDTDGVETFRDEAIVVVAV
jgi:hypothetical protein